MKTKNMEEILRGNIFGKVVVNNIAIVKENEIVTLLELENNVIERYVKKREFLKEGEEFVVQLDDFDKTILARYNFYNCKNSMVFDDENDTKEKEICSGKEVINCEV